MPTLHAVRYANTAFTASYRPTALFVGGTAGIGEGTAKAFARATKGNAHILICGRNKESADKIFATFPKTDQSQYDFIQCDVSLMKNVAATATEIKSKITTLNYLVASTGILSMKGFDPTSEGIDNKLALHFYSRWKFVSELLPLLEEAKKQGQEARVLSILDPKNAGKIDLDDLGLKKNFSLLAAGKFGCTTNNLLVDEYSRRYPDISFTHIYPGFVRSNIGRNLPALLRPLVNGLALIAATSIEDCGEWMAYPLLSPDFAKGPHYLDNKADPVPASSLGLDDKTRTAVVEHFEKEVAV